MQQTRDHNTAMERAIEGEGVCGTGVKSIIIEAQMPTTDGRRTQSTNVGGDS